MGIKRNIYLQMKTLKEARKILSDRFSLSGILSSEVVSVPDAVGRVLSEPVKARLSSPNFHAAAMDGIAVKAENTFGASETMPKKITVGRDVVYVNTGNVMPDNTDAVIMIEHILALEENQIQIEAPAFPWQHVRKMGEDIVATELLFPQNHTVTPYCVGALLSAGVFSVSVKKKPKVLIIPTGSELVEWHDGDLKDPEPGQVIETNSFVLGKLIESCGGSWMRHSLLGDDPAKIREAVKDAAEDDFDIILVDGGSSAGSEDYSKSVINELGEIFIHGVTIMPGKPVIIGAVNNKPVFGIPGYPVSAIIAFEQFVYPLICSMLGQPEKEREKLKVEPTRKIASKLGIEEFLRVKLGVVGKRVVATSLPRGAGCITSITEADGIIRIPTHVEGLNEGQPATAELLRSPIFIRNTIVVVGSHDNTLDVLTDLIRARHSHLTLSSSHVGSLGGLMAIKRGVCHLAGSHLLDPEDGSYNISYIKKYLPDVRTNLVKLVFRDQGLMVPSGNPKGIKGIEDLIRDDITFINRQAGSGTRVLLDYEIKQLGLNAESINGYENEEYTHMSVAVAVLGRRADVGMGIHAAAKALQLDFIPIMTEEYDLIIPQQHFEHQNIQILLEIINSKAFKKHAGELGGYHTEKTGEIINIV